MGFVNPILGGGGALVRPAVRSPNYVPGAAGWTINRDGSSEFAGMVLRSTDGSGNSIVLQNGLLQVYRGPVLVAEITPTGEVNTYGKDSNVNRGIGASLSSGQLDLTASGPTDPLSYQQFVHWLGPGATAQQLQTLLRFARAGALRGPEISGTSESAAGAKDDELVMGASRVALVGAVTANGVPVVGAQSDTTPVSFGTAATSNTSTVTFATPFPVGTVPTVVTNISSGAGNVAHWDSRAINVTSTGFQLFVYAETGGTAQTWSNIPVSWIATPQTQ